MIWQSLVNKLRAHNCPQAAIDAVEDECSGEMVRVPSGLRKKRDEVILEALESGAMRSEIARVAGCSYETVARIDRERKK